jgi:hypothetical protein
MNASEQSNFANHVRVLKEATEKPRIGTIVQLQGGRPVSVHAITGDPSALTAALELANMAGPALERIVQLEQQLDSLGHGAPAAPGGKGKKA